MKYFMLIGLILCVYLCMYSLVNRICACIEHCATAKSFGKVAGKKVESTEEHSNVEERSEG